MTKEVVLQMIWDRHFIARVEDFFCDGELHISQIDPTEKDLDDTCEDIYNEVFVPLLKQARKEMAKEIFAKLIEVAGRFDGKLPIGVLKAWAMEYDVEVDK